MFNNLSLASSLSIKLISISIYQISALQIYCKSNIASMASSPYLLRSPTFSSPFTSISKHNIPCYKPMKIDMSQTQTNWATVNTEVEVHLEKALTGRQPASIYQPMSSLVFKVPRSMAPVLCIAACEAVGGEKEQAIPAASVLHLMHCATYTHEYLQLSDQPRNKPMTDHTFATDVELATADMMVHFGYEILSGMDNSDRVLQVISEVGRAMGSQGMVNGQYLKMMRLEQEGMLDDEAFEKKGGALYSCGAVCGGILGGGSEEDIQKLRRYGLCVGMIHNIIVHDVLGKENRLKKLAENLRVLALKELEGMKDKDVESLSSILDGFPAFLSVQKYQFPEWV